MCLSTEERDSIQSLVEASQETADIAKKLAEFLSKDSQFQEKARAVAIQRGPIAVSRIKLGKP